MTKPNLLRSLEELAILYWIENDYKIYGPINTEMLERFGTKKTNDAMRIAQEIVRAVTP